MTQEDSSPNLIPDRMMQQGRAADQEFAASENLFHAVNRGMLTPTPEGGLFVEFRVGNMSVNRERPDGEQGDVLMVAYPKFKDWGVLRFAVADIKSPQTRPNADDVHYRPVHDPSSDNYYHTEIRVFRGDEEQPTTNIKPSMKMWFRTEMSKRLTAANVVEQPKV